MIYAVTHHYDYQSGELILVTDSLQKCVDAVNNHPNFPYMGDHVVVSVWMDDKKVAISETFGNREVWNTGIDDFKEKPFTFEEFVNNMKPVEEA